MTEETTRERVAYLALLKSEFNRIWPHGAIRSSEYDERASFQASREKIQKLEALIESEIGLTP